MFTRTPDYFDSNFVKGSIVEASNEKKFFRYEVDTTTYTLALNGWGTKNMVDTRKVTVIYNPTFPSQGSLYSFFTYWLKLQELLIFTSGFIILFVAAVFINGKQQPYYYTDEEKQKKRKYDD